MLVTPNNFEESLDWLKQADIITCDTETNFTEFQYNRHIIGIAVLAVVKKEQKSFYFPYRHEHTMKTFEEDENLPIEYLTPVLNLIESKKTIWHNGKFDLRQLETEGVWVDDMFYYDTMILSTLENENKFSHKLFDLAPLVEERKLGVELDTIALNLGNWTGKAIDKQRAKSVGWSKIPPSVMGKYAEEDVLITWKLFKLFFPRIADDDYGNSQIKLYPREVKIQHMVRHIEDNGVGVHVDLLDQKIEQTQHELQELQEELGYDPMKPAQLAHRLYAVPPAGLGFRPLSYSKRKSAEFGYLPNMDEDTLARLDHEEVRKILRYRGLVHSNGLYYEGWRSKVCPSDSRLHPEFNTKGGAKTSRWTCSGPNLMQLPRDVSKTPAKKHIKPTDGYEVWEFDYSQIEFRLGVVYVDSRRFKKMLLEGADIHADTATRIGAYNKFPNNPDQARYTGKQCNFLIINRGGPKVLQKQLWHNGRIDIDFPTSKEYLTEWHKINPEWEPYAQAVENAAMARGYIELWNGKRRHFDNGFGARAAFNSLIQGGAVQIMIESMLMLYKARYKMIAQVHDSVWIEIPKDRIEVEVPKIKEIMEWPSDSDFDLPFPVDAKCLAA